MKATFFSLAALAASAFAAPAPVAQGVPDIDNLVTSLGNSDGPVAPELPDIPGLGARQLPDLSEIPGAPETPAAPENPEAPTDLGGIDGLVDLLTGLVEQLTTSFGNINGLTDQVEAGESTPEEVEPAVIGELSNIQLNLKNIVTQLTGQAGIPVAGADVDRLLAVVQTLLDVLLANVNTLVTILGLRPQLVSILHSVFTLLANLLTLVTGIVAGLVPGLIAALSPLLAGLGNGLLAPLLTPVAALLAALSGV